MSAGTIMVAMSGGVDSSVAAALLCAQGRDVAGVTMCFELPPVPGKGAASCCGLESIEDARRVCKSLGIAHHVLNYGDALEEMVIQDFIREYVRGRTPNPCVRCNRHLKFERLFKDARALGAGFLATGHYVRNIQDPSSGLYQMHKAVDSRKDQSYFLYSTPIEALPFLLFPLGGMTKEEVRGEARRFGLAVAAKKDSQDICFVPTGGYRAFLMSRAPEVFSPGNFIDPQGAIVGRHKGIAHYTIGQREGLGIALGVPMYVNRIDPADNAVHLGPVEKLMCMGLEASGFNALVNFIEETVEVSLKIRYNHHEIRGILTILPQGRCRVDFREPHKAVTPGQAVVFYKGDLVLGGAVIDRAL